MNFCPLFSADIKRNSGLAQFAPARRRMVLKEFYEFLMDLFAKFKRARQKGVQASIGKPEGACGVLNIRERSWQISQRGINGKPVP